MNAMTPIKACEDVQWFAVRMKPNESGGPRTATVDVKREQYRKRSGGSAFRDVKGTGRRVFLPEHLVKRAGFEVFLPVKKVLRKKNRFTGEQKLVSVPLLADWMFVGLPIVSDEYGRSVSGWLKLMDLNVVASVLGTGGRPIRMSDAQMMRLMAQYGGDNICPKVKRRVINRRVTGAGDMATIMDGGPFEGFECRVVEVSGLNAKVVFDIFGRETSLNLLASSLEKKGERT